MELDIIQTANLATRIIILLVLVFALLFVLTWTNTLKCKSIPFWCDAYYAIKGKPHVLIVYGDSGLGDPNLLADSFRNPNIVGVYAATQRLDSVTPGNLEKYSIVIVDHARKMSSEKMKMFIDYANSGGNLVWTGDAGAEAEKPEEYLLESEYYADSNSQAMINPWARKYEGRVVMLNKLLSLDYMANYCDVRKCDREEPDYVGNLEIIERDNPLVYGFGNLKLSVLDKQDFALVKPLSDGTSTTVMTIDFGSNIVDKEKNYGNHLPMIVVNAKSSVVGMRVGENVFYYAMPPEYFVNPNLPAKSHYGLVLRKLYYGIVYG